MNDIFDEEKTYIGIDPGLSGAVAILRGPLLMVYDMPTFEIAVNRKKKRQLDLFTLASFFKDVSQEASVVIEDPNSMPEQGVASSFKFGFCCGATQAAVASHGISYRLVKPAVWKKAMHLTSDKDATRMIASQRMPAHAHLWPLKKHDGRAEAALLALYASSL
jgi:hypothetical protein